MILLLWTFLALVSGDALGDPIFRVPVAPLAFARLADASNSTARSSRISVLVEKNWSDRGSMQDDDWSRCISNASHRVL